MCKHQDGVHLGFTEERFPAGTHFIQKPFIPRDLLVAVLAALESEAG
jgi:hypothetical protein